jgi:hypothetical protein
MYNSIPVLLGYIGPETMLPLASVLAAVMGFILMFWRYIFRLIRRMIGVIFRRKQKNIDTERPLPGDPKAKKPRAVRKGGGDATE